MSQILALCFLVLSFGTGGLQASDDLTWIRKHARPLDTLQWNAHNSEILRTLDKDIANKRIIYLGEPDHYVLEIYDYRLLLLQYLISRGYKTIGLEMGRSDGKVVNDFIQTGRVDDLNRTTRFGNRKSVRMDRDTPAKTFGSNTMSFEKQLAHEKKFLIDLQNLNPTRFFGFDVDSLPGGGYNDIEKLLLPAGHHQIVKEILQTLERPELETYETEFQRLRKVQKLFESSQEKLQSILGTATFSDAVGSLRALIESLEFAQGAYQLPPVMKWTKADVEAWMRVAAKREHTMFWQMDEILKDPNAKVVILGHDFHVAKDSDSVFAGEEGSDKVSAWPMLGTYLNRKYPGDVYSIWMLYDRGFRANGPECPEGLCPIQSVKGSINELLAQALNQPFILKLNAETSLPVPFRTPQKLLFNGRNVNRTAVSNQADLIFFFPEVSSL